MKYEYKLTETGLAKVIDSFNLTAAGRFCLSMRIIRINLDRIESYDDEYAVCHYHAGIMFSNPLAWPVAWVIESIGFVEDLWNEGLLCGLQGVGRSRHFLYERVRLKINEHIVITRKEAE